MKTEAHVELVSLLIDLRIDRPTFVLEVSPRFAEQTILLDQHFFPFEFRFEST